MLTRGRESETCRKESVSATAVREKGDSRQKSDLSQAGSVRLQLGIRSTSSATSFRALYFLAGHHANFVHNFSA